MAAWQVAVDTAAKERDRWSKEAGQLQETVQAAQEKVRAQESRVLDVTRQQHELQARYTVLETTHVQLLRMVDGDGTDGNTTTVGGGGAAGAAYLVDVAGLPILPILPILLI